MQAGGLSSRGEGGFPPPMGASQARGIKKAARITGRLDFAVSAQLPTTAAYWAGRRNPLGCMLPRTEDDATMTCIYSIAARVQTLTVPQDIKIRIPAGTFRLLVGKGVPLSQPGNTKAAGCPDVVRLLAAFAV